MGFFHHLHKEAFEILIDFVSVACEYVTFFGTFMLLGGVFLSSLNIGLVVYNNVSGARLPILLPIHSGKKEVATFGRVRLQLGEITALGLEVLVVADILETLTKLETEEYTWVALGKIGAVAVFRTALAYMLGHEVNEIKEQIHEEKEEAAHHNSHSAHKTVAHKVSHSTLPKGLFEEEHAGEDQHKKAE